MIIIIFCLGTFSLFQLIFRITSDEISWKVLKNYSSLNYTKLLYLWPYFSVKTLKIGNVLKLSHSFSNFETKHESATVNQTKVLYICVIIIWLLGGQVLPDQPAAVIWSLWKPTLPNIRILFAVNVNNNIQIRGFIISKNQNYVMSSL